MELPFDGVTYEPEQDGKRLKTALERVLELMKDGRPRTLAQIASAARCSEAGASARLRDAKKEWFRAKYGSWIMTSKRLEGGLWEYTLVPDVKETTP
jgi:hypothetical protein